MANNTVYHFVGSNLDVEIFFLKKKHQKKGAWKLIETFLYVLYYDFKKGPCKSYLFFIVFWYKREL